MGLGLRPASSQLTDSGHLTGGLEFPNHDLVDHRAILASSLESSEGFGMLREPYQARGLSMRILFSSQSPRGSKQCKVNRDRALGKGRSPEKPATNTGATGSLIHEMLVVFLNCDR